MPTQNELKGMPDSELRNQIIEVMELNEAITQKKKIRDDVLEKVMTAIKKTGRRSVVSEDMDGEPIVIRVVSSTDKVIISKAPKKKTKIKA